MEDDAMSISEGECPDSDNEGTRDSNNEILEPLIAGQWSLKKWKMVDTEECVLCKRCSITFNTRFSFDLHMAGLRHHQTSSAADAGVSLELQTGRPSYTSKTGMPETNVDFFQQITKTKPTEEKVYDTAVEFTPKKLKASDMLERNVGLLQHLTSFNDDSMALPMGSTSQTTVSSTSSHGSDLIPVESPQVSGECTAKRNNMTNVVARNVSLFEKLSNRLVDYTYNGVQPGKGCESDSVKESLTIIGVEAVSRNTDDNIDTTIDSSKVTAAASERINEINDEEDEKINTSVVSDADPNGKKVDAESNDIVSSEEILDNKIQETSDNEEKTNLPSCFRNLPEPVLGADYLCEYRFLNGTVERTCDLCELTITESVETHAKTAEHILRYLFYHEPEAYRLMSVAGRLADTSCIYQVAMAVEQKHGVHHQERVYQETDNESVDADGAKSWTELKDDAVRPISVLTGHRMNLEYSGRRLASETAKPVNDLQTLLDSLALQSCLAQGKPPSLQTSVNRLDLISSIAKFVVKNDVDAEVSLQMANTLTLGVLSFRQQMLPGLEPKDRAKYESRLEKLITEAEIVATKASRREIVSEPVMSIPTVTSKIPSIAV